MKSYIIIILLFVTTLYADANKHIDRINKELIAGRSPDALELFHEFLTLYCICIYCLFFGNNGRRIFAHINLGIYYYLLQIQ